MRKFAIGLAGTALAACMPLTVSAFEAAGSKLSIQGGVGDAYVDLAHYYGYGPGDYGGPYDFYGGHFYHRPYGYYRPYGFYRPYGYYYRPYGYGYHGWGYEPW